MCRDGAATTTKEQAEANAGHGSPFSGSSLGTTTELVANIYDHGSLVDPICVMLSRCSTASSGIPSAWRWRGDERILIVAVIAPSPQRGVPVLVAIDAVNAVAVFVDAVGLQVAIGGVEKLECVVEAPHWRDDMRRRRSVERGSSAAFRTAQQDCVALRGKAKLESQDPRIVAQ